MSDAVRLQYSAVNIRSRWYASQAWQVPFAYLALVDLMAGAFKGESDLANLPMVLKISSLLGAVVVIHPLVISWRISDFVKDLNAI